MKYYFKYTLFIVITAALMLLSVMAGTAFVSPAEIWSVLTGGADPVTSGVILTLRLPRIAMSLLVGASLALSGTIFQAILKNPLADPYIIGVSGGAALGATVSIVFSLAAPLLPVLSFAGSLIVVAFVTLLSKRYRYGSSYLILAGISLSFVLSSVVMLIFSIAGSNEIHRAVMWLMGDLSMARYYLLGPVSAVCLCLFVFIMIHHRHCDIISLGENFSYSMGVSPSGVRNLFWAASLLAALSVSLAGVIGFVGLIVPHVFRYVFGPNHLKLIPLSVLGGGVFLMCCDAAGRSLVPPYEIPVGVITGFFGGMFFLGYLLLNRGKGFA